MASKFIQKPCPQFLLGFVLINVYIPGIFGASIPTGWLFLIIVIPFCLFVDFKITYANVFGFLFLTYAALSFVWSENLNIALFMFVKMVILACVFCLASSLKEIKWIIIGLVVGLIPSDIIASIQYFYQKPVVFALPGNVSGLFVNKNIFCETSVVLLVSLIALKLWWYIPFTLPGIIYVHSRGALLGLFIPFLVWLFNTSKMWFSVTLTLILVFVGLNIERFSKGSIFERFNLWVDTINGFKFFGNGVGSYEILFPLYAKYIDTSVARPRYAHNDLLNLVFEFGTGTILFIVFMYFISKEKTNERFILLSLGIMSMFSYILYVPVTAFIFFLVAGYINRNISAFRFDGISIGSYIPQRVK